MGGGGSNTTSNNAYWNQQTQTYTPSAMIGGMGTQAGTMAQQAAMAPYQMPVSPVAGFTPMQEQGFQELQQQVGMAQPYFGTGASYLAASAAPVSGWDVAQYYNPMAGNVGAQMENIFGRQMQQATGQATQQAGGVGADRIGVAQGMLANQQGLAAGQTFANLYYPALQAAQQQKQMQAGAGYGIAQMGPAAQSAQLQSIQAQMAGGSQQQQLNQAIQNALYNWQVGQVAYPFQTANYLAGVTGGLAGPMGGTTAGQGSGYGAGTTTVNQPSNALGQGLGAGLSLMGMFGKGAGGRVPSYENGGATDYQPPEEQQANIGPRKGGYGDLRSMQMRRLLYPQFAEESLIGSPLAGQVYQTKAKALGTGMQFGGVPGAEYSQQHEGFAPVPGFQMASTVPIHNQPLQGLNTMQPFPKAPSGGGGGDQMAPISKGLKDLGAGVQKQRDQAGDEADDEFDRLSAQTTADPSTDPYATETYSQDTGDWGWEGDPMGGSAQGGGIQPGGPGPIMGGGIRAFRRGGEPEGPSFDPNLDVPNYRDIIDILGKDAPVRAQRAYLNEVAPRKWREPVAPGGQGLPHPQLPKGFPRGFNPDEDEIPGRSLSMNYREGGDTDFGDVDVANPHLDEDRAPLPRGAVYPELEAMKWLGRQASPDMPDIGPRSQPPSFTPPDQRGQIVGGGEQALPPTEFKGWGSAIRGIPAPEDMTSGLPPMDPGTTRRLISGFQRDPQTGEVITPTMDPFKGVAATDPYTAMLGSRPATAAGPRPDISFTDPMSGAIGPPGVTQAQAARPTPSDPLTGERLSSDPRGDPIRDPMGDFATGALAPGEQVPMPRGAAHPWERTSTPSLPGIVTDELVAGGLGNKHAIAGAMRTVSHESAWNPAMRHWDQPHHTGEAAYAHGLWSEGGDEWRRYTWWRANNAPDKPWDDPRTQAKFTAWNWKTNYPQMWAKLQNAKSPGEAAAIITHDYLKPSRENMNWRLAEYRRGAPSFESYFNQAGQTPDVGTRMAALTGTATDAHPEDPYAAGKPPSEATPRRATPVQYQSPIPTGDRYQRGPGPGPGAGADDRGLFGTGLFSRGWGERLQHDPVRMALIQAGAGMMGASSRPGSLGAAAAAGFGGFGTSIERGEAERRQELKSDRDYELKAQNLYDRLMQHQDTESRADRRLQFQERSQGERLQAQIQHQRETESHARLEGIAKNLREQGFTGDIGMEARKQDSMMFPLPAVPEKDRMEGFRYTDTAPGHVWHSQEWLDKTAADKAAADKKKKAGTGWFGWGTAAGEP
jgi:hypothetical protein